MHVLAMILQIVFVLGLIGCAITIPLAAWGYFSVLVEKDTDAERGIDREAQTNAAD